MPESEVPVDAVPVTAPVATTPAEEHQRDQESSVPTTAAPSAEAMAPKKKSANSKSKKKRQHAALQSMITQLKQLCNQVGQQTTLIDSTSAGTKMMVGDNAMGSPSATLDIDSTLRGMRIPPSVWKPQMAHQQPHTANSAAGSNRHGQYRGLPPPREIRLTAAERESIQQDKRQKELRMKLRCAVTIEEFESLLAECEKASMKHEADLVRKKIQRLKEAASAA